MRALYGGSFDPPHIGHIKTALKALEILPIDELIVVPAFRNPFKSSVCASSEVRLQWLKRIFEPYDRIHVSDFEISMHKSVPTIETVNHFAPGNEKLYLIIGADNLESLPRWHRYDELSKKVVFVIATRDEIKIPDDMITLDVNETISSSEFRRHPKALGLEPALEREIITYYKEKNESKN